MHLFLIDLYISLDMLSPIMNEINPKKVLICNIHPIQDYKKNKITEFILKAGAKYYNYLPLANDKKFLYFLLKILLLFPCVILNKLRFIWLLTYKKICFSSEKKIETFLIKNNVKSINFEEGAPLIVTSKIYNVAKKLNIPTIKIASGLRTGNFNKIGKSQLKNCDYYLSPNQVRGERKNEIKRGKIKYFGSLRYSKKWMLQLRKIFILKKEVPSKKIKIGIFKKFYDSETIKINQLIARLSKQNYLLKSREKPRDVSPLKCTKFYNDSLISSQLIDWSDVILAYRSSSLLVEAIINDKKIILLEFINKNIKKSAIYNFKFILKAKKEEDIKKLLTNKIKIKRSEKMKFVNKFLIDYYNYKSMSQKYKNFYNNL